MPVLPQETSTKLSISLFSRKKKMLRNEAPGKSLQKYHKQNLLQIML